MKTSRTVHAPSQDQETHDRLIHAAVQLFSERGFRRVTVREICQAAGTNVAAVNYHFRDKFGLYTTVIHTAIEAMRTTTQASQEAGEGLSPQEKLRAYIRVYLRHIMDDGRASWIHGLMSHEMTDATPALDMVFEEVIAPRIKYLCGIVAELMGASPSDERVFQSVISIQGQCLVYAHRSIRDRLTPRGHFSPSAIDKIADHITKFSLAGIQACRANPCRPRKT